MLVGEFGQVFLHVVEVLCGACGGCCEVDVFVVVGAFGVV